MLACKCVRRTPPQRTVPFFRVIHRGLCKQRRYARRNAPESTHQGQMKLLLSEIEFLTPFLGRPMRVIYAGAAPGVHMPILARMFETMRFVLVDPQSNMVANGEHPNIEVVQALMTDALAQEFAARYEEDLLFISDVRMGPPLEGETASEHQDRIQRDMDDQRRWLERMRPLSSILKFRLPWREGLTPYLSGRLYLPVYGKKLTHEARLVVQRDAPPVDYDNGVYEGQMAYFNWVLRPAIQPAFGGGRCYDCTAFRWIVCKYMDAASVQKGGFDLSDVPASYTAIDARCVAIEQELARLKAEWNAKRTI